MEAAAPPRAQVARAFAPASVGNVAVGFDILGHVVAGAGDGWWTDQVGPGRPIDLRRWRVLSIDWLDAEDLAASAVSSDCLAPFSSMGAKTFPGEPGPKNPSAPSADLPPVPTDRSAESS